MKKGVLIVILFILGAYSGFSQSYVDFEQQPPMHLSSQPQYTGYKIKYRALEKSTIYLELKQGNIIVASGVIDVPRASEKTTNLTIKSRNNNRTNQNFHRHNNYSYNLYMYAGGRNDFTRKTCKSVSIPGVKIDNNRKQQKPHGMMSLRSLFD